MNTNSTGYPPQGEMKNLSLSNVAKLSCATTTALEPNRKSIWFDTLYGGAADLCFNLKV